VKKMYLILGSGLDPCCVQVNSVLRGRGEKVRMIEGILSEPHRFVWRFAGGGALGAGNSCIGVPGEWEAASGEIEGVLVRETWRPAAGDWSEKDALYMSAEMQAALLGWLWSLPGAVVNRPPAWLFYRPRPPFIDWVPRLHRAGLRTLSTVISNDGKRLNDWRARHDEGSIFSSLSEPTRFQLRTDAEWEGVMRVAHHVPILLQEAHGGTQLACVVGDCVVWDGAAPEEGQDLEARLRDFARITGIDCVQIAVAEVRGAVRSCAVVAVDPQVQFSSFCEEAQEKIAEALANLLTDSPARNSGRQPIEAHAESMEWGAR
jgi:hypothetical protein